MLNLKFLQTNKNELDIPEYRQFSKLRLLSILIIGFFVTILSIGIYFVYNNIYETINEIQSIVVMKSEFGAEIINFDSLEKVKTNWNLKHQNNNLELKRNPFVFIDNTIVTTTIKK